MTHLHRRHAREAQLPQRGQHPRLQRHRQRLPCALRDVLHGWRRRGPPWPLNRPGHFRFRHCGGRPETELRRQRFRVAEAGRVGGAKSWLGRGQVLKQKTSPGWSRVPEGVKLGGGAKSGRRGQVRVGDLRGGAKPRPIPGRGQIVRRGLVLGAESSPGGGAKTGGAGKSWSRCLVLGAEPSSGAEPNREPGPSSVRGWSQCLGRGQLRREQVLEQRPRPRGGAKSRAGPRLVPGRG